MRHASLRTALLPVLHGVFVAAAAFSVLGAPAWVGAGVEAYKAAGVALSVAVMVAAGGLTVLVAPPDRHRHLVLMLMGAGCLAVAAVVTLVRGGLSSAEITGFAFDPGTASTLLLAVCAFVAGVLYASTGGSVIALVRTVTYAFACAVLAFALPVLTGNPFALFSEGFSVFLAIGAAFAAAAPLAAMRDTGAWHYGDMASFLILGTGVVVSQEAALVASSAPAALAALVAAQMAGARLDGLRYRIAGLGIVAVCVLGVLLPDMPVRSAVAGAELRPSHLTSAAVLMREYAADRAVFFAGASANGYAQVWTLYRPAEVNRTPLWDVDFPTGSSFALTTAAVHGMVFFLALMLALALVLSRALPHAWRDPARMGMWAAVALVCGWLFLYPPTVAVLVVAALFAGILGGQSVSEPEAAGWRRGAQIAAAILCVVAVVVGVIAVRHWRATAAHREGIAALESSGVDAGLAHLSESYRWVASPATARMIVHLHTRAVQETVNSATAQLDADVLNRLGERMLEATTLANAAVEADPTDFRNWLALGHAYTIRELLDSTWSHESALEAFRKARLRAPEHPLPLFLEAQTLYLQGDADSAIILLDQALQLKPDYESARTFREQIRTTK